MKLTGDAARACYGREVGRQLATIAGRDPDDAVTVESVAFTSPTSGESDLLCELHERLGNGGRAAPSWLGVTGPSENAPRL